jgi:hypothetical protein
MDQLQTERAKASDKRALMADNSIKPERPRAEPEIIPPDRSGGRGGSGWPPPPHGYTQGVHRVYVSRIGPLGFALLMLVVGLFAGVMLLILVGAALIWIPVVAVLLVVAAISGLLRRL